LRDLKIKEKHSRNNVCVLGESGKENETMATTTCVEDTSRAGKIQSFSFYVHVDANLAIKRDNEKWVFSQSHDKAIDYYINESCFYSEMEIKTLETFDIAVGKEYSGARLGYKTRKDIPAIQQEIYVAMLIYGSINIWYGGDDTTVYKKSTVPKLSQELREELLKLWRERGLVLPELEIKVTDGVFGDYYEISTMAEWFGLTKESAKSLPEGGKIRSKIPTFWLR
jgi:hypothetical protein